MRLINKDGSFNLAEYASRTFEWEDLYHYLLTIRWTTFFFALAMIYVAENTIFGSIYFFLGHTSFHGLQSATGVDFFIECFFFSVQTFATIGYGRINPVGMGANLVVSLEALVGLLSAALATGILFARFSRPSANVLFSKNALISLHDGKPALTIRMANKRRNQIVDASVKAVVSFTYNTKEGQNFRMPYDLKLVRGHSSYFAMSWTIIHEIDESSPLAGKSLAQLKELDAEIIIALVGIDSVFSSSVSARSSYKPDEIRFNSRFDDMIFPTQEGKLELHIDKIDNLIELPKTF